MKNCLDIFAAHARALAIVGFLAGSVTVASAQAPQQAQQAAPQQKYVTMANGDKIPLYSGIEKHAATITALAGPTIIDNRIDSNAILNLDAHPLAAVEAPAPAAAPKKVAEAAKPVAHDLKAELKDAKTRYAQARADLKGAQKAKDQTKTVTARHDVAVAKSDIERLKSEIAAAKKQKTAK